MFYSINLMPSYFDFVVIGTENKAVNCQILCGYWLSVMTQEHSVQHKAISAFKFKSICRIATYHEVLNPIITQSVGLVDEHIKCGALEMAARACSARLDLASKTPHLPTFATSSPLGSSGALKMAARACSAPLGRSERPLEPARLQALKMAARTRSAPPRCRNCST